MGGTVTWSNDGQVTHTVMVNGGSFNSGDLNPGQSFSHTFTQSGTFSYYCQPHRFVGMKGTVTVLAADSSGGGRERFWDHPGPRPVPSPRTPSPPR